MSQRQMNENATPISDAVHAARNVQEAIQAIARGLDEVLVRLDRQPTYLPPDPWASAAWSPAFTTSPTDPGHSGVAPPSKAKRSDAGDQAAEIAAVREQLQTATGEDTDALLAKLRLLQDDERNVPAPRVPDGKRYQQDGDTVDLVSADVLRKRDRFQWAIHHDLHTFLPVFGDDANACAKAFAKGGAMWLYLDGREAIMQMPYEWRQWLVQDIAVDSEAAAQEVGADILKHRSSTDKQIAVETSDRLG